MKIESIETLTLNPNDILIINLPDTLGRLPIKKINKFIYDTKALMVESLRKSGHENQIIFCCNGIKLSKIEGVNE